MGDAGPAGVEVFVFISVLSGKACQKQHVDILPQALISITTRHRMIFAIFG